MCRRILLAVDGSGTSDGALREALARDTQARLRAAPIPVLRVREPDQEDAP